jgi:hypothetical protein
MVRGAVPDAVSGDLAPIPPPDIALLAVSFFHFPGKSGRVPVA